MLAPIQMKIHMKKIIIIIIIAFFMQSCSSTYYVTNSSFYNLNRGMSKQEFRTWKGMNNTGKKKPSVGTYPFSSKTFKHGENIWEVWVFQIYDCKSYPSLGCVKDHVEHVAFKNRKLEEWGTGTLPITIRQNPNQFQYDINTN
jgi:hypothetical protein